MFCFQGEDGSGAIAAGGGFEFGVDPNEDPELALALRVSMEEQRARQEAEATTTTTKDAETTSAEGVAVGTAGAVDDDAMLQKALSMSMDTDEAEVNLEAMTEEEQVTNVVKILKWKVVIKVGNFFNLFLIHLLLSIIWQRDLLFNNSAVLYLLWFILSTRILTPIVVSISFTTPRLILRILYI